MCIYCIPGGLRLLKCTFVMYIYIYLSLCTCIYMIFYIMYHVLNWTYVLKILTYLSHVSVAGDLFLYLYNSTRIVMLVFISIYKC